MEFVFGILALLAIVMVAVAAVTFIGVRMSRGSKRHGTSGSLSGAMLDIQSMIDPSKKKVIEARQQMMEAEDEDDSGE